jgi:hypothetical protein|tara:strand:+ start:623 stop:1438 length:816 start_codon:yes stop_codon:yes gene_type:complete
MAQVDIGKIKIVWKGPWNSGTAYTVDDAVSHSGNSYICIQAGTNQNPSSATAYWQIMASAGTNGTDADLLNISGTVQGDIYYNNGSAIARLAPGTASQLLQSGGASANPSWTNAPVGIAEADMWRLTANHSGNTNGVISSNLERVDDGTFAKIGTGMSVSSGHWIFPSTGLWQVIVNPTIDSYDDRQSYVYIEASTDGGSNYDALALATVGINTSTWSVVSCYNSSFVNVTNTSNDRVKFSTSSMATNSYLRGDSGYNLTSFVFIRLGDSQ